MSTNTQNATVKAHEAAEREETVELQWDGGVVPLDWPAAAAPIREEIELNFLVPQGMTVMKVRNLVIPLAIGFANSPRGAEQIIIMPNGMVHSRYLNVRGKNGEPHTFSRTKWYLHREDNEERKPIRIGLPAGELPQVRKYALNYLQAYYNCSQTYYLEESSPLS